MVYETFKDRRPKEPRVEELQREAKRAKSELDRALQVPVPEDEELDELPDACQEIEEPEEPEEPDQPDAFEAIQGSWRSAKGECAIFTDPRINRLTYEESLSDQDARLHGWLEPYEDEQGDGVIACWVAVLHLLGEDELPWYGPSFGEEPEALGQIKVEHPN
ncbi:Ultraviolet-B receptor UVR8 [Durusdinium trenchii]|uniref:Ultraviolet-B receptor UVR8 n=1 Tax=Durusdinium trenchii TaxID=1381693 RepID=A0ABP0IKX6_9DINO